MTMTQYRRAVIIVSVVITFLVILITLQTQAQPSSIDQSHLQESEFNYSNIPYGTPQLPPEIKEQSTLSEQALLDTSIAASYFYPSVTYSTDSSNRSVDIGDLNNDTLNDVALISGAGIYIYLQNQNGTLDDPVIYPTEATSSIAIGDLNLDNLNDIVINNQYASSIDVYLQKSDGTLANAITYAISESDQPGLVQVADMNNDGSDDVVVLVGDYSVAVLLQNANGTLDDPIIYNNDYNFAVGLALGDVNNDGLTDMIRLNREFTENAFVSVYIQQDGTLMAPLYYDLGDIFVTDVTTGDVTGDGRTDVIVTRTRNIPETQVIVLTQTETGDLSDLVTYGAYEAASNVKVYDIDWDGLNDIVVTHSGWGKVSVHYQEEDGNLSNYDLFSGAWPISSLNGYGLAVGDVTDDGMPDLVVSGQYGLTIFEHTGLVNQTYIPISYNNYISPIFDDFSNPNSGWPIADTSYNLYAYWNGEYRIMNKTNNYTALATAGHKRQNFDVSVDVRKASSAEGAYGIAYGITDDGSQYTSFIIWPDYQEWWLLRFDAATGYSIVNSGTTSTINMGLATNTLRVERQGSTVTFQINGYSVTSTSLSGGEYLLGLFAAPLDSYFDARFDNYYLWVPQ